MRNLRNKVAKIKWLLIVRLECFLMKLGKMTFLAKMASNVNFVTLFSKQNTSKFASVTKLHKKSNLWVYFLHFALCEKICRLLCRKCRKKELTRSDFEPTLYWKEKPFLLHLANAGLLGGYNLKSIDSLTTLLNRCCEDKSIFGGLGFHLRRFAFFASTLNAGKNRMWRLNIHGFWNEFFFCFDNPEKNVTFLS